MSSGRWTRVALGLQAALAAVLAVVAALFAVEVADWRYWRVDLSLARKNSLDPAVLDVIEKLPEPVTVDVFFRGLRSPYDGVAAQAQARTLEYLRVVGEARRDRLEVVLHDERAMAATQERLNELGVEGMNKVVVSCGARKAVLELFGELALVDWGNPNEQGVRYLYEQGIAGVVSPRSWDPRAFRPAQFQEFRGEEPLVAALLKVSSARAPRVYFTEKHGEPPLAGSEPEGLARFAAALRTDGFEVASWDPLATPGVPADAEILCLVGASQPYPALTREAIARWIQDGGQVLVAPAQRELEEPLEHGLASLLANFGILLRPGLVCQPVRGLDGLPAEGQPECATLVIDDAGMTPGHPLTEPLRMRQRQVQFFASGAFEAGGIEGEVGLLLPLVSSGKEAWRDLPPRHDWRLNPAAGEVRGKQTLVTVKQLAARKLADGSVRQGRILVFGSASFFASALFDTNRDFALNALNWLAERDYRLAVRPLPRGESHVDFQRGLARPLLTYGLGLALPGAFLLIGLVVFLRRRG